MTVKWIIDKDWLYEKYVVEKLSTREIASIVGCKNKTISLRLKEYEIKARSKKEAEESRKTGMEVLCSNECGKRIYRKLSKLNKFIVFFCSWDCEKEYQSKVRRKSIFKEGWRSYGEYRAWRKLVKSRDVDCLLCHSDKKLVSHHILEASTHPDLVYDVNNGATLCQSCHILIHQKGSSNFIKPLQEAIFAAKLRISEKL